MHEGVRARVETGDEREATRVDEKGEVAAGSATFRFSVDRPGSAGTGTDVDAEGTGVDTPSTESDDASGGVGDDAETKGEEDDPVDSDDPRYVAPLEEVPTNGTIRCEALGGRRGVEFICRREGDEAFAWRNSCPHEPDVRLDPGWGAMVRDGQIVCHEHGARFECGDGLCTYGPCRGKVLDPIDVDVREGSVYLTDERFEACHRLR